MKHFYLIVNPSKQGARELAEQMMEYLRARGACCEGSFQKRKTRPIGFGYTDPDAIPKKTECVITLGGDGTLIQAARDLVSLNLPLVGVNMGHLGYLTQVSAGAPTTPMLDALLRDAVSMEQRMMLEGRVEGPRGVRSGIALNDIVLARNDVLQMLRFQVHMNGLYFNEYMADGMIAATPTGSTAYNLSAGGPIVAPRAEMIVLTPICPHSLNSRSIVLSASDEVGIRLSQEMEGEQTAVFDGDQVLAMDGEDTLYIRKSEHQTTLIQLNEVSFLENLRNRMNRI